MAVVIHTIKGNAYAYDHHREGDKVVSTYIGPVGGGGRGRGSREVGGYNIREPIHGGGAPKKQDAQEVTQHDVKPRVEPAKEEVKEQPKAEEKKVEAKQEVKPESRVVKQQPNYDGKTYQLTPSDLKKVTIKKEDIPAALEKFDKENKEKLGKKFGLKKRDFASDIQAATAEYRQGVGQGRLDRANGLPYREKTDIPEYNHGYYNGYNANPSGYLKDAVNTNPNFAHLKKQ